MSITKPAVVFLPGGIMPASLSYVAILGLLGDSIRPFPMDLAIYDSDVPPADYSLDLEVKSLLGAADRAGLDRFHLVGYSVGGTIALLCAELHRERVQSLVLFEPTLIDRAQTERILAAGPDPRQQAQMMLRAGATPPMPQQATGSPPQWMAKRPAAFVPIMRACRDALPQLGRGLRSFEGPVLYALGADSNPEFFDAERIRAVLPQMHLEIFAGCSHPNPPFRAVPGQAAQQLQAVWKANIGG
jgi:pimeloyl-ACP methyl ester carboxylesterase